MQKRATYNRGQRNDAGNIDTYIARFPALTQKVLQQVRQTIHDSAPNAIETMSYSIPTFDLQGKHLVHFAAFTHHIGFYPTPGGVEAFRKEIAHYIHAKGSVQFPLDKPIPYNLIKKMVAFRMKEIQK